MTRRPNDILHGLIPLPKHVDEGRGTCRIGPTVRLVVDVSEARIGRAVFRWSERLAHPEIDAPRQAPATVRVALAPGRVPHRDGYRLDVQEDGIELLGGSPAGCFHGLQTLTHLTDFATGEVPCCTIVDEPDFAIRGLLHDVTRGKVPTLGTFKGLVDRLANLKINQLQLYIEHAFVFAFGPDICGPDDGLTPDEIRELDAYCRERFIDLVPAVATLGHMGRILSMPKYRQLAETEPTQSWEAMSWPQRARGNTLDILNPQSHALVERMWSDILDAFSGPVVNMCGDEPWDLGQEKNRERLRSSDVGDAYIDHILRTHAICTARGRRTQVWSDVVRKHANLLHRLPSDLTILHWGYDDRADYEGTRTFVAAGLKTFVCPGTSGWKRIINAIGLAERNLTAFAAAGRKHGAEGLLNTDWGDHGHFNALACSWHGIALGASLSWNAEHPTGPEFDARFARTVLGLKDAAVVRLLRDASRVAEGCETWRLMWTPLRAMLDDPTLPSLDKASEAADAARATLRWFESVDRGTFADPCDLHELAVACRFSELLAEKVLFARSGRTAGSTGVGVLASEDDRGTWADELAEAIDAYAQCWRARNKPSGLNDIVKSLERVAGDLLKVTVAPGTGDAPPKRG